MLYGDARIHFTQARAITGFTLLITITASRRHEFSHKLSDFNGSFQCLSLGMKQLETTYKHFPVVLLVLQKQGTSLSLESVGKGPNCDHSN